MLGFPEHVVVTNKPYKEVTVVVGLTKGTHETCSFQNREAKAAPNSSVC